MEKITCAECLESIINENSNQTTDSLETESRFFEDLIKFKILSNLKDIEEPYNICNSCKYWLEKWFNEKIEEAELQSQKLDHSLICCEIQIQELKQSKSLENSKMISESLSLDDTNSKLQQEILALYEEISELNAENALLDEKDRLLQYSIFTNIDTCHEIAQRTKIVNSEIDFLSSTNLYSTVFSISSVGKLGTINEMRLGRLDSQMVPWDEINAAWGHSALLLSTLYRQKSIKSKSFNIYPCGACSRISYKTDDEKRYELFFSDYNFTNLIFRYNQAQKLFLEALKEFAVATKETGMPYPIHNGSIEGISVEFDPNRKERWTQALRFVLQNLKYLLCKISI